MHGTDGQEKKIFVGAGHRRDGFPPHQPHSALRGRIKPHVANSSASTHLRAFQFRATPQFERFH